MLAQNFYQVLCMHADQIKNNHREASNNYCYLAQSADEVYNDAIVNSN